MIKLTFLWLLLAIVQVGNAQNTKKHLTDEYGNPMHYSVAAKYSECNIFLVVDSGTKKVVLFEYLNNYPLGNVVLLKGSKSIELESRIHKDSLNCYRYSIIENDTTILKKDAIPKKIKYKWGRGSILPDYVAVDLGLLNIINKKVEVKIYKLDNKQNVTSVIVYNKLLLAPSLLTFAVLGKKPPQKIKKDTNLNVDREFKGLRITRKKTDIDILYAISVENLHDHSISLTEPKWNNVSGTNLVIADIKAKDLERSGQYRISVYPKTRTSSYWKNNSLVKNFSFSVEVSKERRFSSKELGTYIGYSSALLGLVSGLIMIYIKRKNKAKLLAEQQQTQIAQLQLESVRSQLNPHFLFNALAGIQNLMNKHEIEKANHYLAKFARLTRNVLDSRELVSLTQEKTLLDDYLQMEQLRFGFHYKIEVCETLDIENIELPAMLLQPFVENAVKHGISENGSNGKINVEFQKHSSDLVLKITDNGKGFDTRKNYSGLGLALSKNRISLLNAIYKEMPFDLEIKSNTIGTTITITLTQWL